MRRPTARELTFVSFGTAASALFFTAMVVVTQTLTDLLLPALEIAYLAAVLGSYIFAVTRKFSSLGSKLASSCLIVGWVPVALLPLLQLSATIYYSLGYSLLAIGIPGFVYIVFVEIQFTMPRRPGSSRHGRLFDVGFLLIILGSAIAFIRGFPLQFLENCICHSFLRSGSPAKCLGSQGSFY